jgi:hypothetical protein
MQFILCGEITVTCLENLENYECFTYERFKFHLGLHKIKSNFHSSGKIAHAVKLKTEMKITQKLRNMTCTV